MLKTLVVMLLGMLLSSSGWVEGIRINGRVVEDENSNNFYELEYTAINCRAHAASITDFGGVGDGKTLNTKAFQNAVNELSQYADQGGAQLFVPAGRWLTGSFNLTSHFTLFLDKDAVLLASQVLYNILLASFFLFPHPIHLKCC